LPHRLAVLAVADDVDAGLRLTAHDLLDRRGQASLVSRLVGGLIGLARAVELDQVVGARQAPRVAGQDALVTASHRQLGLG